MNKILIVCGPTSTGKTDLGFVLANKFGGEIISADSRQVYKGMDIGTGKKYGDAKIWGYDLVDPSQEFSVSHFVNYATDKIKDILDLGKMPIVVGGTGFYIKALLDGFETVGIPKNEKLRENLEKKTVEELFEILSQIDSIKSGSLNLSDRNNPRRLVRAIEVATWLIDNPYQKQKNSFVDFDKLYIGLKSDLSYLDEKIDKSVDSRMESGIIQEIEKLLSSGVTWDMQSMQALGYKQWRDFFEGEVPLGVVIDEWKKEERNYVRRQLTWFNKDKRINWFDIRSENLVPDVVEYTQQWNKRI